MHIYVFDLIALFLNSLYNNNSIDLLFKIFHEYVKKNLPVTFSVLSALVFYAGFVV
jgi:hypothetical protein